MSFAHTIAESTVPEEGPLVSNRFLAKIVLFLALMACLTGAVVLGGGWLGKRIKLAGHTDSTEFVHVVIGRDRLSLPKNVIRFETQRQSGTAERLDLYLLWPEMEGFSGAKSTRFNDLTKSDQLIFLQVTQSVMSRDMSGRVEPIYAHYFTGEPVDAGYGLSLHRFSEAAGYDKDVLLTAHLANGPDYAVRCVIPARPEDATSGDCQRDIFVGQDLSVLYRFSSNLLPQWQELDDAVRSYVSKRASAATQGAGKMR